jgi:hypothetical protein
MFYLYSSLITTKGDHNSIRKQSPQCNVAMNHLKVMDIQMQVANQDSIGYGRSGSDMVIMQQSFQCNVLINDLKM